MKRLAIAVISILLLNACVVTPVGYHGYYHHDYYRHGYYRHGYWHPYLGDTARYPRDGSVDIVVSAKANHPELAMQDTYTAGTIELPL